MAKKPVMTPMKGTDMTNKKSLPPFMMKGKDDKKMPPMPPKKKGKK